MRVVVSVIAGQLEVCVSNAGTPIAPQDPGESIRAVLAAGNQSTWMEIMAGEAADGEQQLRAWLSTFRVIPIDESIAARAVKIRKAHRIKLPDAIVWASAQAHSLLLVSLTQCYQWQFFIARSQSLPSRLLQTNTVAVTFGGGSM